MLGTISRWLGTVFVVVGILGFAPPLTPNGNLLGLFPVNAIHNLVHIALGIWGLVASGTFSGALFYMRGLTVVYLLLAILGLFPATNTLFGLAPIHGADVALHGLLAVLTAYCGFGPPSRAGVQVPGR
jgi:Domain of unknown function (DUF4383)